MKISRNFTVAIFVIVFAISRAIGAQFTYETPAELSSTLDADGDGKLDLIVVDKATGVRQLAIQQADGTFVWADPTSVGLDKVTALTVGNFTPSSSAQGFAVASPHWNRVQVWPSGSATPASAAPPGVGPNTVVALDVFGGQTGTDGVDDLVITTESDDPPGSGALGGSYWNGTTATTNYMEGLEAPFFHANRARFSDSASWMLVAIQPTANGSQLITRPDPLDGGPSIASLSADATWVWANFDNTGFAQFLTYSPGTSTFSVHPILQDGPGRFAYEFEPASTFDFGLSVAEIIVLPKTTGAQLLVIFGDGSTAGIYDFDGVHAPIPREALSAPSGTKFSLAGALGAGNFLMLNGPGGGMADSSGWQRWNFNGTTHTLAASGSLPSSSIPKTRRANVLVYSSDPNVTPDAPLLKILQAGEWSVSATVQGDILQVASARSQGAAFGLGTPVNISLGGGFTGSFPSLNQSSSDTSLAAFLPAIGSPVGEVSFSPQPGTYHLASGATLTVQMTATPDLPIHFRTDPSLPWSDYDPAAPPQISTMTTFQAYAGTAFAGIEDITPSRTAVYSIAAAPPVAVAPTTDANGNGISDNWESTFDITDPNGDDDGDGFSNRDEYLAGTDPLDPNSKPTPSSVAGVYLVIRKPGAAAPAGTRCEVAWPATIFGAILETTTDITQSASWRTVPGAVLSNINEHLYYHPIAQGEGRRYFRLRSLATTPSPLISLSLTLRKPGATAPAGTEFELAWPLDISGGVLETTTDLAQPSSWQAVPGEIFSSDFEQLYYHPFTLGETRRFFRLRQQ